MYAFSYRDFTQPPAGKTGLPVLVARMTLAYALRDALGLKDLIEDTRATLRGEGINYRAFEPSEGAMHVGAARDRRIRAGLRYAAGGKRKYWLPERVDNGDVTAPLFAAQADDVVHDASDVQRRRGRILVDDYDDDVDEYALTFGDGLAGLGGTDEVLYEDAKRYMFGDYRYPVVDVSSEETRRAIWAAEDRVVRDIPSGLGRDAFTGYGATQSGERAGSAHERNDALRTPSPPRLRISDSPITPRSRVSSHAPSPTRTRFHFPHLLSPAPSISASASGSRPVSRASTSPRVGKRAPLLGEDAVDLVVSVDSLQVPSTSRGPHSPTLVRVWDEAGPDIKSTLTVEEDSREQAEEDVRFVITVDEPGTETHTQIDKQQAFGVDEADAAREGAMRAQMPPMYTRGDGYGFGIPEEEDNHNPWA